MVYSEGWSAVVLRRLVLIHKYFAGVGKTLYTLKLKKNTPTLCCRVLSSFIYNSDHKYHSLCLEP